MKTTQRRRQEHHQPSDEDTVAPPQPDSRRRRTIIGAPSSDQWQQATTPRASSPADIIRSHVRRHVLDKSSTASSSVPDLTRISPPSKLRFMTRPSTEPVEQRLAVEQKLRRAPLDRSSIQERRKKYERCSPTAELDRDVPRMPPLPETLLSPLAHHSDDQYVYDRAGIYFPYQLPGLALTTYDDPQPSPGSFHANKSEESPSESSSADATQWMTARVSLDSPSSDECDLDAHEYGGCHRSPVLRPEWIELPRAPMPSRSDLKAIAAAQCERDTAGAAPSAKKKGRKSLGKAVRRMMFWRGQRSRAID